MNLPLPLMRRLLRTLASRLLRSSCALCGQSSDAPLCRPCCARYLQPARNHCPRCASEVHDTSAPCARCVAEPPAFDACFAAARYAAPLDQLVLALKFRANLPLAAAFAERLLAAVPRTAIADADLLMAVPLSSGRLAERGFNQALEIARPIARAWQLPLSLDACARVRETAPQSTLPLKQRRDNMRGAFAVMRREAIAGRHVIVIDDVMTTGHTLDALANCLKRHGAVRVTALAFARTPRR